MRMKKYVSILAVLLLLTACGQKDASKSSSSVPEKNQPDVTEESTIPEVEEDPVTESSTHDLDPEFEVEPEATPSPWELFDEKMTNPEEVAAMTTTEKVTAFPDTFTVEYNGKTITLPVADTEIDAFFTEGMELAEEKESSGNYFYKYRLSDTTVNIEKYDNGSVKYGVLFDTESNVYYTQYKGAPYELSMDGYTPDDVVATINGIHVGSTFQEVLDTWGPPTYCDSDLNTIRHIRTYSYMWTGMGSNGKGYVSADFHMIELSETEFELKLVSYSLDMG